ncbi:MAG: hypothetical protein H5U13_08095 [Parvibaculum sp.]|nr:hypothetical protein [Parvibaculum sp.]
MTDYRKRIIDEWTHLGFRYFEETMWSSSLQQKDLPKIKGLLSINNFSNVDVALAIPQDDTIERIRWLRYYQIDQCMSVPYGVRIPTGSNHLKFTLGFTNAEERGNQYSNSIAAANIIRLIFGVPAARELMLASHFSDENSDSGPYSDIGYASPFDNQSINLFENPPIEKTELNNIPQEASLLLDKAFVQPYAHERFILMWLAFEAIVHSFPGGGDNGEKRQRFFVQELNSNTINEEVYRLFKFRNSIFKEGVFSNTNVDDECWSLYAVLQLAIMKDCPQRQAFLEGYEKILNQRRG